MIHLHQFQEVFLLNETLIHLAKNQLIQRAGKARQLWLLTLRWLNCSMTKNVGLGVCHSPKKIKSGKPIDNWFTTKFRGGGGTYSAKDDFQWNLCMMSLAMTCGYIFKNFDLIFLGPEGGGVWISTTKMLKQRDRGQWIVAMSTFAMNTFFKIVIGIHYYILVQGQYEQNIFVFFPSL